MRTDDLIGAFDAFEERTRGRETWPHRVALEPLFRRILPAERTRGAIVDDSRKPSFWDRLRPKPPLLDLPRAEEVLLEPESRSPEAGDLAELTLLVPKDLSTKGESALRLLSSLRSIRSRIAFEVVGTKESVWVQLVCPSANKASVTAAVRAYFPDVKLRENPCALGEAWVAAGDSFACFHLGLEERVFHPLRADGRFDIDPLVEIVTRLDELQERELGLVQILVEPANQAWGPELVGFVKAIDDVDRVLPLVERKFTDPPFAVVLRVAALADDLERAIAIADALGVAVHTLTRSETNQLSLVSPGEHDAETEASDLLDREARRTGMILSPAELATLVHLPSAAVRSERLLRQSGRTKAAPAIAIGHSLVIGTNDHDGDTKVVSLPTEQRLRHVYAIGASGTGKSTLVLSMAAQDIAMGNGFAILDPHGDLVEEILTRIPVERARDVILFDPADEEYPIGFNILSAHSELERTLLASDLVSVFKRLSTTFGDVMVSVLGNAALAFLESTEGGTLLDLRNFLVDPGFRDRVLKTVRDEEVVSYWRREFTLLKGVPHAPVLTRLNTFLRPKLIRRMVAQKRDRVDFRRIMDSKTIFLAKLSHGAIGEENAQLLGSLLVSKIAQAAMSRQNIEAAAREPYTVYIDEFHHFVTPSIASILTGTRKYGLGLVLAHQEMRQLKSKSEDVASAVLANPATRVVFRVGEQDAKSLADGFSFFQAKDLQSLGVGEAIARVERADFDFNLRTQRLDPVEPSRGAARRSAILEASRAAYATPQADVDAVLSASRVGKPDSGGEASTEKSSPEVPSRRRPKAQPDKPEAEESSTPGRGGSQHKYLQGLLARQAVDRGFEASIEKTVLGGHGHVDVALEGHGVTIGCEISVTTKIEHEVGNLTKCLAAGFDYAVLISSDARTLDLARAEMSGADRSKVRILTPHGFTEFLDELVGSSDRRAKKHPKKSVATSPADARKGTHMLTPEDAAMHLGLAKQTLAKYRVSGEGPPYHKLGRRITYDRTELDAWLAERKRSSTSDRRAADAYERKRRK